MTLLLRFYNIIHCIFFNIKHIGCIVYRNEIAYSFDKLLFYTRTFIPLVERKQVEFYIRNA